MEALQCYASDNDSASTSSDSSASRKTKKLRLLLEDDLSLPPPPTDLLSVSNSSCLLQMDDPHRGKSRSFPHVEGNYALHVYIPVILSSMAKGRLEPFVKKALSIAPELQMMDYDSTTLSSCKSSHNLVFSKEYHISLSRTVPIVIHQIDSIVSMLRHKFEYQRGYSLELDHWQTFVNDDQTRSFLSLEVIDKGLHQICKQISLVNEVFELHRLHTFYETPQPHVSIAWTLGNISSSLLEAIEELNDLSKKHSFIWSWFVNKIECKIGNRIYNIWKEKSHSK